MLASVKSGLFRTLPFGMLKLLRKTFSLMHCHKTLKLAVIRFEAEHHRGHQRLRKNCNNKNGGVTKTSGEATLAL